MARFKTSARTVDMLGRQQIAGIPTAMSELFKNSYDAYATEVRADYFPALAVLALRDDGVGMSHEDFLERWLTLGTDSKTPGGSLTPTRIPKGVEPRQQMGEKGIGRLAIASIAPLVLITTRAQMGRVAAPLTAALVPWTLFETPGLTLDEIEIPVITAEPDAHLDFILESLGRSLLRSLGQLRKRIGSSRLEAIEQQIRKAQATELGMVSNLEGPQVSKAPGTTFVLFGTGEDLQAAVQVNSDQDQVPEFQRFLGGFTNTITRSTDSARILTRFVIHEPDQIERDLIGPETFWRRDDFDAVDHVIRGDFDSLGTFRGTVQLYRGEAIGYTLGWGESSREPRCGPFKITLGVLQGDPKESRLPADEFVLMTQRLRAQGGLYIYRDDIRVLPYGNSDVDYLQIEKRRTLNAGRYYFSHRRMFGAIELSASRNPQLQEKAGREGFRQNGAYRDFVTVLERFLQQVAIDFFRSGGEHHDEFKSQRDRLTSRAKARAEKEKREKAEREKFSERLGAIIELIQSGRFEKEVTLLRKETLERMSQMSDVNAVSHWETLMSSIRTSENRLGRLIELRRPSTLALTSGQEHEYESALYLIQNALDLLHGTVGHLRATALERMTVIAAPMSVEPSGRAFLAAYADELAHGLSQEHDRAQSALKAVSGNLLEELASTVSRTLHELESVLESESDITFNVQRVQVKERKIEEIVATATSRVAGIHDSVERAFFDPDVFLDNRHLQERVLDLEDEADNNVELMQLGLAVQLVNHEMETNIGAVRIGLRRLQPWAVSNPRLGVIVQDVRNAFQHLDGYLRMFTPLQRRLYRRRVTFTGEDLLRFGRGVFDERLKRHNIRLEATDEFRRFSITGFPSSFYPVLLNLIDNAIHWVQLTDRKRVITLDAAGDRLLVADSGPGIAPTDRAAIFERGFSRRRGGRGLGLSLAREILKREGWNLSVGRLESPNGGAEFEIAPELPSEEFDG